MNFVLVIVETPTANEYNVRNVTSLAAGKETMDEMAEKENFFRVILLASYTMLLTTVEP